MSYRNAPRMRTHTGRPAVPGPERRPRAPRWKPQIPANETPERPRPCPHPGGPAVHLEALRRELAGRGWITSLPEPPGWAALVTLGGKSKT